MTFDERWSLTEPPADLPMWPRCPRCNGLLIPLGLDRMRCNDCRWMMEGIDLDPNDPLGDEDEGLL